MPTVEFGLSYTSRKPSRTSHYHFHARAPGDLHPTRQCLEDIDQPDAVPPPLFHTLHRTMDLPCALAVHPAYVSRLVSAKFGAELNNTARPILEKGATQR